MKHILLYPFPANGIDIAEIEITRPLTARDLVMVGGDLDDDETYFRATANALQIAPKDFDRVDFEDLEAINEKLEQLANESPIVTGFEIRRPQGRDVIDVQRDRTAKNLVQVIARLSGRKEDEVMDLSINQFTALVGKVSDFIGRRRRK